MSFWKKVGGLALDAGSAVLGEAKAAGERSAQYKEEMPLKSDDELFKIAQKERVRSVLMAGAAIQELKNRGFTHEEIKQKIS